MSLTTVSTGNTILANDVNQLVYVLQRGSGQSESGQYYLGFNPGGSGALGSLYLPTLSRGSIPVSVTIDTSLQAPSNCNSPGASNLSSSGFQITTTGTTGANNAHCAGQWTVNY